MGGPRLCLGGRSPILYQVVESGSVYCLRIKVIQLVSSFLSILSIEKGMGGPRLCLGGRSPITKATR
jgi:hypothetical protein